MAKFSENYRPILRTAIDIQTIEYAQRPYVLIRDLLELTGQSLLISHDFAPLLTFFDGSQTMTGIQLELQKQFGLIVSISELMDILAKLDQAFMLENERFHQLWDSALANFREAEFRPMSCTPHVYPADPLKLQVLLDEYCQQAAVSYDINPLKGGRGVVSPHIDFQRGGKVYAGVWQQAANAAINADVAVIFGTDHYGDADRFTLTRQDYATPYGILPTDQAAVNLLSQAVGEEAAFAGELRHRIEHSIELAAIWLHHVRQQKPIQIIPILCGGFEGFIYGNASPDKDPLLQKFLSALHSVVSERQVLYIAAGDLAHVGPAFGGKQLTPTVRSEIKTADDLLIKQMVAGSADGFLQEIRKVEDCYNVCGTVPIFLMLKAVEPAKGTLSAYDSCPADQHNTSSVTICGLVLD